MRYKELLHVNTGDRQLTEMASPTKRIQSAVYYHGTSKAENAQQILIRGLIPGNLTTTARGLLQPVAGRTYLTPSLEYGVIYAIGGHMMGCSEDSVKYLVEKSGRYGYLFVVNGADILSDVQPDEDSVGEAVMCATEILKNDTHYDENSPLMQNLMKIDKSWLESFVTRARSAMTPKQFHDCCDGWTAAQASGGKRFLKVMSDADKLRLIDFGAHVAYLGPVNPSECWKFDKFLSPKLAKDGSNFFELAEKIR